MIVPGGCTMDEKKRADFLQKGEVEIRVQRAGVFQNQSFRLVRHKTPIGDAAYMKTEKFLPMPELVKICEEYGLPIDAPTGKVFPRGKKETDFVGI